MGPACVSSYIFFTVIVLSIVVGLNSADYNEQYSDYMQQSYNQPPPQYQQPEPAYEQPRYRRSPSDSYYDKPSKGSYDSGKGDYNSNSYGSSYSTPSYGFYVDTSLYWMPQNLIEYVIDLKGKDGGTYEPGQPWKADCNGYSYGYKYGWLTAIWSSYEFKDLGYLKCAGPKDDYDKYGGFKLDLYDTKVIEFTAYKQDYKYDYKPDSSYGKSDYKANECHKGYLLTALWGDYGFKNVKWGKCARLEHGLVDYSSCDNIPTDYRQGGTYESHKRWNVECPVEWAAVGLKRGDYDKIEHLRCCKIVPPSPPVKSYSSGYH